jgi:hypothetical protein
VLFSNSIKSAASTRYDGNLALEACQVTVADLEFCHNEKGKVCEWMIGG